MLENLKIVRIVSYVTQQFTIPIMDANEQIGATEMYHYLSQSGSQLYQ